MTHPNPTIQYNTELSLHEDSSRESTTLASTPLDLSTLLDAMPKITQTGQFTRLPNELIESVLKRLEVQILIPLRLVSPRWNVIIESLCQKKRSLVLVSPHFNAKLLDRVDGQPDLNRRAYLKLKPMYHQTIISSSTSIAHLFALLGKLFPCVEYLVVNGMTVPKDKTDFLFGLFSLWSVSLVTLYFYGKTMLDQDIKYQICSKLNAMINLKNFEFYLSNESMLPLKSLDPTLERLHSFSFGLFDCPQLCWNELVSHLGPNCTSLKVDVYSRDLFDLRNWPILIAQSPVTHLHLNAFVPQSENFIYRLIAGQFAATLKSLRITNRLTEPNPFFSSYTINPVMSHLTQLSYIRIDGPTHFNLSRFCFRDAPNPMTNIRSFSMYSFRFYCFVTNSEELFCMFFSAIFPNLERLTLHYQDASFGGKVRPFLNLFKALRYHDISYDS